MFGESLTSIYEHLLDFIVFVVHFGKLQVLLTNTID